MSDSILISIKKNLGLAEEYEIFDPDIIMYINSILSVLNQIGFGPDKGYRITGPENKWSEFIPEDDPRFENVKTYIYIRVKMLFDPPSTPSVQSALQTIQSELEWRINVASETPNT